MSTEAKIPDPKGLFRCRYCKKCVIGIQAFIIHKRENHGEEVKKRKLGEQEKETQASRNPPEAALTQSELTTRKNDKVCSRSSSTISLASSSSVFCNHIPSVIVQDESSISLNRHSKNHGYTVEPPSCTTTQLPNSLDNPMEKVENDNVQKVSSCIPLKKNTSSPDGYHKTVNFPMLDRDASEDEDVQFIAVISTDTKEFKAASMPIKVFVPTLVVGNSEAKIQNSEITSTAKITRNLHNQTGISRNDQLRDNLGAEFAQTKKLNLISSNIAVPLICVNTNQYLDSRQRGSAKPSVVPSWPESAVTAPQERIVKSCRLLPNDSIIAVKCSAQQLSAASQSSKKTKSTEPSTNPQKSAKKTYKCSTCDEVSATLREKNIHMRRVHVNPGIYKCKLCSQSFSLERSLTRHRTLHLLYSCKDCCQKFNAKTDLDIHVELHERQFSSIPKRSPPRRTEKLSTMAENTQPVASSSSHTGIPMCESVPPKPSKTSISDSVRCSIPISEAIFILHQTRVEKDSTYKCPLCRHQLKSKVAFRKHVMRHTGERPYKCSFCDLKFTSDINRRRHEEKIHGTAIQRCLHCPAKFLSVKERMIHQASHIGDNIFKCRICPEAFDNVLKRSYHEKQHFLQHPSIDLQSASTNPLEGFKVDIKKRRKTCPCSNINKIYPPIDHLRQHEHEATHTGEMYPYRCKYCGKDFVTEDACKYHENTHTNTRPFKCSTCSKSFRSPAGLDHHIRLAHVDQGKVNPTDQTSGLPKSSQSDQAIIQVAPVPGRSHKVHAPAEKLPTENIPAPQTLLKKHVCRFCGMEFEKIWNRMYHEDSHTGLKPFRCQICAESFSSPQLLTRHETNAHNWKKTSREEESSSISSSNAPIIQISDSDIEYLGTVSNSTGLSKKQSEGEADRRFKTAQPELIDNGNTGVACNICGKFLYEKDLVEHQKSHSTEKKVFICDTCGKTLPNASELSRHRIIHSRPYSCTFCKKTFDLKVRMEDHVRTSHTKERPFQCVKCARKFASEVIFIRHVSFMNCSKVSKP